MSEDEDRPGSGENAAPCSAGLVFVPSLGWFLFVSPRLGGLGLVVQVIDDGRYAAAARRPPRNVLRYCPAALAVTPYGSARWGASGESQLRAAPMTARPCSRRAEPRACSSLSASPLGGAFVVSFRPRDRL